MVHGNTKDGKCPSCKEKPRHKSMSYCLECYRKYKRAYVKKNRKKINEYTRDYRSKNPEKAPPNDAKHRARVTLNTALARGKIKKPRNCVNCNQEREVEGHHEDYSKPLEVEWLCRLCHMEKHMPHGG